jgi:hypothetical protein
VAATVRSNDVLRVAYGVQETLLLLHGCLRIAVSATYLLHIASVLPVAADAVPLLRCRDDHVRRLQRPASPAVDGQPITRNLVDISLIDGKTEEHRSWPNRRNDPFSQEAMPGKARV